MRNETYPQIVAISATTAEEFEERFNEKVKSLAGLKIVGRDIDITGNSFSAVITYEVTEHIIDSVADEFHLEGIRYLCRHCPHLDDPKDRRVKYCTCKYSETGTAHKEHEACEIFYRQLKLGKITPIDDYQR